MSCLKTNAILFLSFIFCNYFFNFFNFFVIIFCKVLIKLTLKYDKRVQYLRIKNRSFLKKGIEL